MKKIEFIIEKMSCGWCSGWVQWKLMSKNGIISANVSHKKKIEKIEYDESMISENDLFEILLCCLKKRKNFPISQLSRWKKNGIFI